MPFVHFLMTINEETFLQEFLVVLKRIKTSWYFSFSMVVSYYASGKLHFCHLNRISFAFLEKPLILCNCIWFLCILYLISLHFVFDFSAQTTTITRMSQQTVILTTTIWSTQGVLFTCSLPLLSWLSCFVRIVFGLYWGCIRVVICL